jgi:hypothetical protein
LPGAMRVAKINRHPGVLRDSLIRSPSQWPGIKRSSTSRGRR